MVCGGGFASLAFFTTSFISLKDKAGVKSDINEIVDEALIRLKKLMELYSKGNIEEKRNIIGSIFPEKWTIIENKGRTGKVNLAALLIYQINNMLGHKKAGVRTKIRTNSGLVLGAGIEPALALGRTGF